MRNGNYFYSWCTHNRERNYNKDSTKIRVYISKITKLQAPNTLRCSLAG